MNHARIEHSERLQRVLAALRDGPKTTRDLIDIAGVCAVNSIAAELRANGYDIPCRMIRRGVFLYELRERHVC